MKKRGRLQKILGFSIACSLLILVFTVLLPPTVAIDLSLGTTDRTSNLSGGKITFNNVNITIRGIERIPLTKLNFTIKKSGTTYDNISFDVFGNVLTDNDYLEVRLCSPTASQISNWFTSGQGYEYGYGSDGLAWGNPSGEGYGYGSGSASNITFCYEVNYTTRSTGSYTAQLWAQAIMNGYTRLYHSTAKSFTVSGSTSEEGVPAGPRDKVVAFVSSQDTLTELEDLLGTSFDIPFYAKDSDNDGLVDEFTDPNGKLSKVKSARDGSKVYFLLDSNNDGKPDILWNSADDTIAEITTVIGTVEETQIDTTAETVTIVINVEKDGWIYIELDDPYPLDEYPDYTLTVQTSTGRTIANDYVWRENGKVYILDDPSTQYLLIYEYEILKPIFSPVDGAEFTETRPTIIITYYEEVSIQSAKLNGVDIRGMLTSTDMKTYNFTPSYTLASGVYELTITVQDNNGNSLTESVSYIVNLPSGTTTEEFPWMIIAVLAIILLIAAIIVVLKLFII